VGTHVDELKTPRNQGTYVYCVIAGAEPPSLARVPRGLPGTGAVRALSLDRRTWVIVATAPLRLYGETVINRKLSDLDWVARVAVAHERVIESFVDAESLLPMKLLTIFAGDERALEHLRKDRRRLARLLARVAHHDEWGVRVAIDTVRPLASDGSRPAAPGPGGVAYLTRKKMQRDRSAELRVHARQVVARLYDRLAEASRSARRRPATDLPAVDRPLLLDAAFLVSRRRAKTFQSRVARERTLMMKQGYRLMLTGPWPAYTFVQE
jgi:hypothetical protein